MTTVTFFGEHRARLGESPLWDVQRQWLWWVDSLAGNIHAASADGETRACLSFNQAIGSIGLTNKGLIAALADGFYDIDVESGAATLIVSPARVRRVPSRVAAKAVSAAAMLVIVIGGLAIGTDAPVDQAVEEAHALGGGVLVGWSEPPA